MASLRSLSACALLVASGCSFAIQGPDPKRPRNEVPKCDTGKGAVGMDGLMVTLMGLASLASFAADESGAGLAFGATAGLFLASGMRGNRAANECRAAYEEYNVGVQAERQQLLARDPEPRPRPVAQRKPRPPVAAPVAVEATPPPAAEQPTPDISAPYATPRPAVTKQIEPPPPSKPAPKRTDATDDDWSSFWKEAP